MPPDFASALRRTLGFEGGYSKNPFDPGGETYCGISRRSWPEWPGWANVDRASALGGLARDTVLRDDPALAGLVADFYRAKFWMPLHADSWPDGAVAADVFDAAVNLGMGPAVKTLQQALGFAQGACDGMVGAETLSAVIDAPTSLQARFAALRSVRYADIAAAKPEQVVWLPGWLRRALAFALS